MKEIGAEPSFSLGRELRCVRTVEGYIGVACYVDIPARLCWRRRY
jgi:hypothetical protein